MWILFKNISRYVYQKKFSIFGIFILLLIAITIFVTFGFLSTNLMQAYDNLVQKGNLDNIVVDEDFKPSYVNKQTGQVVDPEAEFENELGKLGVAYRQFNSLNITTNNSDLFKVISYPHDANIDRLVIFNSVTPLPEYNGHPTLPKGANFAATIQAAQAYYTNPSEQNNETVVGDLQKIVYEAAAADWSNQVLYPQELSLVCQYMDNMNPTYNPASYVGPTDSPLDQALASVAEYLKIWLDPSYTNYTPPVTNGYRVTFSLTNLPSNNLHIPILGYYSDFTAYIAVVSPAYLTANNKKIYSYAEFMQRIDSSQEQMISQNQFIKYFDSIPDQYKVFVDKVPYVIVGSGISPGFMYPIIDFQNIIPNAKTQGILYTNQSGYGRIQFSFPTAPTEDMMVCKYTGTEKLDGIISEVNVLAHKYMAFPSNMTLAYAYNNTANTFSPTGLRVSFVTKLVLSIRVVSAIISIFILIMSLIVILIFTKKFIEDNQTIIAVMLANGIDKYKIIFSISLIGWLPALLSGIIGFLIGFFSQSAILGLFSDYWMVPTPTAGFNFGELFLSVFCTMALFIILTFLWSFFTLRKPVIEMMKAPAQFKMNVVRIFFKKMMDWAPTIVKFRFAIASSSMGKIMLLSVLSVITTVAFLFIASTANSFQNALALSQKENRATFQVNLATPTIDGGQYTLQNYVTDGQPIYSYPTIKGAPHTLLNDLGYSTGAYANVYDSMQSFRTWSGMFWPCVDNLSQVNTDPTFLQNRTSIQLMLNDRFGVASTSSNPWLTTMAMIPANQANTSVELTNELAEKIMANTQPIPWISTVWNSTKNPETGKPFEDPFKMQSVGSPMFSEWVIGNIGVTNPNDWTDNDGSPDIGFINANEVSAFAGKTAAQILALGGSQILTDINTDLYGAINPAIFQPSAGYSFQVINPTTIRFQYHAPANQYVVTDRSLFMKWFCKPASGTNNLVTYTDPFNTNNKYVPNNDNTQSVGESLRYSDSYINFISHMLSNPLYQQYLYKFTYDSIIDNPNDDEPFTYITATAPDLVSHYKAPKTIQINGIMPNSKMVYLTGKDGKQINNLLFQPSQTVTYAGKQVTAWNLIPNAFAMKFYNLHVGEVIAIDPQNTIWRYEPNYVAADHPAYFKIVAVSNTVHNASFWTSMTAAQETLGLATAYDYTHQIAGPMNNEFNPFGGFNGILTSQASPFTLTKNIALYSPSGLYPGTSQFELNSVFGTLIENLITDYEKGNTAGLNLVFKGLYLSQTSNPYITEIKTDAASTTEIAGQLIAQLRAKYGSVAYFSIIEKPVAFQNMAAMFNSLSSTIVKIKLMIAIIVLVISLMMMFLLAWITINDLIKIAALLKTQGFSDWSNALNFFSLFIPVWLFATIFTIPLTMLVLHFYNAFIFASVSVLLTNPINAGYFIAIILGLSLIFFVLFSMALTTLKKLNLVQVLKW